MPVIEKTRQFSAVEHLPRWNDEKIKLAPSASLITECTCTTRYMSVHDAMCPHCWARLIERNSN
jgi:hypothetical protein